MRLLRMSALAVLFSTGCTHAARSGDGTTCGVELGHPPIVAIDLPPFEAPKSSLVVELTASKRGLGARILDEAKREGLLEPKNVDGGGLGRFHYEITAAPPTLAVDGDDIVSTMDVTTDVSLCKSAFGLGCVRYAGCRFGTLVDARIAPILDAGFQLPRARVAMHLGECKLTALELRATPILEAEATRVARELEDKVAAATHVDVKSSLAIAWRALGTSVPVGVSACVNLRPLTPIETPPTMHDEVIALGAGIEAEVRVTAPCAPPLASPELPAPRIDRDRLPAIDLAIPITFSWDRLSDEVSTALAAIDEGGLRVTSARVYGASGPRVRLTLRLAGRACGEVTLEGSFVYDAARAGLRFDGLVLDADESARVQPKMAVRAFAPLIAAIERQARVALPFELAALPRVIAASAQEIARSVAGKDADRLTVELADPHAARVESSRSGLVVVVAIAGHATVHL